MSAFLRLSYFAWLSGLICHAYDEFRIGIQPSDVGTFPWRTKEPLWLHAEIPVGHDGNPAYGKSSVSIRPWADTLGFSKVAGVWALIVPDEDPGMLEYIRYVKLAVKTTGQEFDAAIRIDTASAVDKPSDAPHSMFRLAELNDKFVEVFSLLQNNCGFLSFNVHSNKPDMRFDALFEIKTIDKTWQQAPLEEKEFFACWPIALGDPTQIQASKSVADTSTFPHLFGRGDVPGLECHQVWLYLTYYGYNYNFKKDGSGSDNGDSDICDNRDNKSEFDFIEEALYHLEDSGSQTSGTDQVLTPQELGGNNLSQLGEDVDLYADTPLIDHPKGQDDIGITDLQGPSIVEENEQSGVEKGSFLEKAFVYEK
ncbi:hypothetical protein TWF132_000911 [Orbilia oligospora]|nr:hypothetical protein TWF751_011520 [Orbilia oligospora]KAF3278616.1 hypothetical protein TWF132_000911 [Orbilia oligospora]